MVTFDDAFVAATEAAESVSAPMRFSAWAWTEVEKQAAVERLRLRRVDIEALPQSPSRVASAARA